MWSAHFLPRQSDHETAGGCARAFLSAATCSLTLEPERVRGREHPICSRSSRPRKVIGAKPITIQTDEAKLQFDAAQDHGRRRSTIAVSIEKGGSADERVQINSSRMVVVSNATFIQDNAITQDQQALDFVSASVNWLLSREQLIGIAPKIPKTLTFSLDEKRCGICAGLILVLHAARPGA